MDKAFDKSNRFAYPSPYIIDHVTSIIELYLYRSDNVTYTHIHILRNDLKSVIFLIKTSVKRTTVTVETMSGLCGGEITDSVI